MPVLIDQISAEIETPPQNQSRAERNEPTATPSQQQQLDFLRRKLRQMEQRKMRLKAD